MGTREDSGMDFDYDMNGANPPTGVLGQIHKARGFHADAKAAGSAWHATVLEELKACKTLEETMRVDRLAHAANSAICAYQDCCLAQLDVSESAMNTSIDAIRKAGG